MSHNLVPPQLFDTHCHLASDDFKEDLDQVLKAAKLVGVANILSVATNTTNARQCLKISREYTNQDIYPQVHASMGLHPHEAKDFTKEIADDISKSILSGAYVAVGETGIDYHYDFSDEEIQRESFDFHCELAIQSKKPLIIHCRESVEDIYEALNSRRGRWSESPGVMHCFSENWEWGQKFLDLGFYLSFSGILTFKAGENIREVAKVAPVNKILIETDAPYLAPVPHRGRRNEPAFIQKTFAMLCQLRDMAPAELAPQLELNSRTLFQLS